MMPMRRGIDAPVGRVRAHHADGALRVAELDRMVVARPEPVAQHEGGDAERVEVARDLAAFVVRRERTVAAARAHDHRRRIRRDRPRQVHRDRRDVAVVGCRARLAPRPPQRHDLPVQNRHRRRLRGGSDRAFAKRKSGSRSARGESALRAVLWHKGPDDEFTQTCPGGGHGQHGDEPRQGLHPHRRVRRRRSLRARHRQTITATGIRGHADIHVVRRGAGDDRSPTSCRSTRSPTRMPTTRSRRWTRGRMSSSRSRSPTRVAEPSASSRRRSARTASW